MLFDNLVKNKVTEFTVRCGDDVCSVKYEYNIESLDDVVRAFETQLEFLGYGRNSLKDFYREEIIDEYNEDEK